MLFTVVFILERFLSETESKSKANAAFASNQLALEVKNPAVTSRCTGFQLLVFRVALFLNQ